jgi:hypothetical protein
MLALCLVLLTPGIASAKKPTPAEPGCELLLAPDPSFIYTGNPYTVKLVRVPSYPGAFRQPTVSIDVSYPMSEGSTYTVNDTRSFPDFNVTYMESNFVAPSSDSGIAENGVVEIDATVTEPVRKNKFITTSCTTTATVVNSN